MAGSQSIDFKMCLLLKNVMSLVCVIG